MKPSNNTNPTTATQKPQFDWVARYLVPLEPSLDALRRAKQFDSVQEAWDHWDCAAEMMHMLAECRASKSRIVLCTCEIVEPAVHILDLVLPARNARTFHDAIKAARFWANDPHPDNYEDARDLDPDVRDEIYLTEETAYGHAAATAVRMTLRTVAKARNAAEAVSDTTDALIAALDKKRFWKKLAPHLPFEASDPSQIARWQCDCVRKHFPTAPFLCDYE
jgi:hypothetical protein